MTVQKYRPITLGAAQAMLAANWMRFMASICVALAELPLLRRPYRWAAEKYALRAAEYEVLAREMDNGHPHGPSAS